MKKAKESPSIEKIEDYLKNLEKKEKEQTRKKGLTFLLIAIILISGISTIKLFLPDHSLNIYQFTDIDDQKIAELEKADALPIILKLDENIQDTIFSMEDYIDFQILIEITESDRNYEMAEQSLPPLPNGEQSARDELPNFKLKVLGKRLKDNKLWFSIKNYDPEGEYFIDFGNGYKTSTQKLVNYTYHRPGNYEVTLTSKMGNQTLFHVQTIQIETPEQQFAEATTNERRTIDQESFGVNKTNSEEKNRVTDELNLNSQKNEIANKQNNEENTEKPTSRSQNLEFTDLQKEEETEAIKPKNPIALRAPLSVRQGTERSPLPEYEETEDNEDPESVLPKVVDRTDASRPISFADRMPQFPGGSRALTKFVKENRKYPSKAIEKEVEGVVYIRFVVNPDGGISDPYIIKSVGYGCDEEAKRLVYSMPKWFPGEHKGVKVSVYKTIPVSFKLNR